MQQLQQLLHQHLNANQCYNQTLVEELPCPQKSNKAK